MKRAAYILGALCVLWLAWRGFRLAVGSPRAALTESWGESTRVYARDGRLLGERASASGLHGERTTLDQVSPRLVTATLTSEDHAFYTHDGVDRTALVRAALTDIGHHRIVAGGSTITSQLVKRLDHRGSARARTFRAKVVEIARAQNLEGELTKAQILEAYFNRIDYGRGYAGPEAAARGYFGISANDVSLAQAALLAVLPRAPTALEPSRHLERAQVRQRALLATMRARGEITEDDLRRALAERLVIEPSQRRVLVAPHVVLAAGGGDVHTTLDFELQRDAEALVKTHASRLRAAGASGAAVIVIDNATGEVIAEVGSADYFDRSAGAVDLVRRKRQAGSTLKPFVYAHAFERGLSPMAPLPDVPTDLGTTGAGYAPDNFDGTFAGPVAAREALAASLNVPAVRLVTKMGANEAVRMLRATGLALKDGAERYGVSIALGSGEVSPWELAGAYLVLARGGDRLPIRDREGAEGPPSRVFDAASVALVTDALADPLARVRGLRARGAFELNFPVAMKTGTSTGYRDAWTAGYTHERTIVVWVGNPNGAITNQLTGAMGAGPLFIDLMRRAMRDVSPRAALVDPSRLEVAEVCPLSGLLAGPECPDRVERRFANTAVPGETCKMHTHREGRPVVLLPPVYARFLGERPLGAPGLDAHGLPWLLAGAGEAAPEPGTHAKTEGPRVVLVKPRRGAVFRADEAPASADAVEVIAVTEGLPPETPLEVLIDGESRALLSPPYHALVAITRGAHDVEVRPKNASVVGRVARADIDVR